MTVAAAGAVRVEDATLAASSWVAESKKLYGEGWWFEGLWGRGEPEPGVLSLWGRRGELRLLRLPCPDGVFPSLTALLPSSDWFERAVRDRVGLEPAGHVDPRPFLFHENYPVGHVEGRALPAWGGRVAPDYPFLVHEGPGVFELPVGPIHAGIIEPGHFRFTTVGEIVLDLEVRLNYAHKGTLTLAKGKRPEHALRLMERLSGDNAAAHGCAFAAACEAALGIEVPEEVQRLRTGMVEMERVYNHLGDLAGIAVDVAFSAAASHFQALREECMRWNQRLFGHRLLMNAVAVGGLHGAPSADDLRDYVADVPRLRRLFERAVTMVVNHSGLKERVEGTGVLSKSSAELLGCVGPAARASGVPRDARVDHPCLGYPGQRFAVVTKDRGSVSSRMLVKIEEARASLEWLATLELGAASVREPSRAGGEGVALVEASRGAVLSWVNIADGVVDDVFQRDPSFLNWRALEEAVLRNIVPDFPLINKSFNLSYSGSDA